MSAMKPKPVTTKGFDVEGNPIGRVMKQDLIFRVCPIGSFGGGPNLKYLLQLWFLHHLGRPLMWLSLRFEGPIARIARMLKSKK